MLNSVTLTGNLTRDPELRHAPSGTAVCTFGIAVNGREKDASGAWVDRADFFEVTCFGRTAESVAQYCQKGRPVGLTGRLRCERWTTDTGEKRSMVKVIADRVQFFRQTDGQGDGPAANAQSDDFAPAYTDDDIPF